MKHITAVVATCSRLLNLGIKSALAESGLNFVSVVIVDHSVLSDYIVKLKPALLILDPMSTSADDVARYRELLPEASRVVCVASALVPRNVAKSYDVVVGIYDDLSALVEFVKKCATEDTTDDNRGGALTPREKDVLVLVVKGFSNKEIATEIHVSVNTVMTHRRNIASKLQIHSTAGLTIYAIVSKLVTLDEIKTTIS